MIRTQNMSLSSVQARINSGSGCLTYKRGSQLRLRVSRMKAMLTGHGLSTSLVLIVVLVQPEHPPVSVSTAALALT